MEINTGAHYAGRRRGPLAHKLLLRRQEIGWCLGCRRAPHPRGLTPCGAGQGGVEAEAQERRLREREVEENTKSPGEREKESGGQGGTGINPEGSEEGSEDRHRGEEKA